MDHIKPLACGGADVPETMQRELGPAPPRVPSDH